jgi:DNA-binding transcriptional ArsR family regulator
VTTVVQPSLWDQARTRGNGPDTSRAAARRVQAGKLAQLVLDTLRRGPMTTRELAAATGKDRVTISPRLRPLAQAGKVRDTGIRREGSIVWAAT